MFKFIIIVCFILFFIALYNILKPSNSVITKQEKEEEIDYLIANLKNRIQKSIRDIDSEIEGAETDLEYYKKQLEKAEKQKEKLKNL